MARKFFLVCAGLLCLTIAFEVGAKSARAQSSAIIAGVTNMGGSTVAMAVTTSGDSYFSDDYGRTWSLYGNVFGGATAVAPATLGQVKMRYR